MKEIGNLDEQALWTTCFPHFAPVSMKKGVYIMPKEADLLQELQQGKRNLYDKREAAVARLELACAALWPSVADLFVCDFFPHLLAAATDILRATDFGEGATPGVAAQVQELVYALNGCEKVFAAGEDRPISVAADPGFDPKN